jgi:hypothetical protein
MVQLYKIRLSTANGSNLKAVIIRVAIIASAWLALHIASSLPASIPKVKGSFNHSVDGQADIFIVGQ